MTFSLASFALGWLAGWIALVLIALGLLYLGGRIASAADSEIGHVRIR